MQDCLFLPSVQLHQQNTSLMFANIKKALKKKGTKIQVSVVQMSPACRGNCAPFTFAMHLCRQLILLCLSNVIYVKPLSWTYCFVLWSPHFSKVSCQSFLTRLIHDPVRTPPHPVGLFAACHFLISLFLSHWADDMSVSRIENCLSFAPKACWTLMQTVGVLNLPHSELFAQIGHVLVIWLFHLSVLVPFTRRHSFIISFPLI